MARQVPTENSVTQMLSSFVVLVPFPQHSFQSVRQLQALKYIKVKSQTFDATIRLIKTTVQEMYPQTDTALFEYFIVENHMNLSNILPLTTAHLYFNQIKMVKDNISNLLVYYRDRDCSLNQEYIIEEIQNSKVVSYHLLKPKLYSKFKTLNGEFIQKLLINSFPAPHYKINCMFFYFLFFVFVF